MVSADQFSVRVAPIRSSSPVSDQETPQLKETLPQAVVLNAPSTSAARRIHKTSSLRSWNWKLEAECATYHGLFPRAWTTYEEPVPGLRLMCSQISPVFPHNYSESSIPAAVFVWTVENTSNEPLDVSILFTFQNGDGGPEDAAGGHFNKVFDSHSDVKMTTEAAEIATSKMKSGRSDANSSPGKINSDTVIRGVSLTHKHRTRVVFNPKASKSTTPAQTNKENGRTVIEDRAASMTDTKFPVMGDIFEDNLTFSIAALETPEVEVSSIESFDTSLKTDGGAHAAAIWHSFLDNGSLKQTAPASSRSDAYERSAWYSKATIGKRVKDKHSKIAKDEQEKKFFQLEGDQNHLYSTRTGASIPGATLGAALCQRMETPLKPGESRQLVFALSWDSPSVRFGSGKALPRRYSRFFGREGNAAPALTTYALSNWHLWDEKIIKWQHPILQDSKIPSFYKSLLFNELYFLVDGGTIWTDSCRGKANALQVSITTATDRNDENQHKDNLPLADSEEHNLVGQFLYLEGHEYLMYNTYDVHFYASFALILNWPMLQISLQEDFSRAVMQSDEGTIRKMLGSGARVPRKIPGVIPHDLGSPCEEPWTKSNVYNFQDVSRKC